MRGKKEMRNQGETRRDGGKYYSLNTNCSLMLYYPSTNAIYQIFTGAIGKHVTVTKKESSGMRSENSSAPHQSQIHWLYRLTQQTTADHNAQREPNRLCSEE